MNDLGEVIKTARRAQGLTQEELADAAGLTQATLSRYENGQRDPDEQHLDKLAGALGLTAAFLRHAKGVRGGMAIDAHMRRRQTAKATVWRQIEARLNVYRMHASLLFEEVSLRAENRIPTLDPLEVAPDDAARIVRMQWRMPTGPIRSLIEWLEAAGCLVIAEDFGTTRVDGVSQWVEDHPIILLNQRASPDRKRLTLAHELGHLVLHSEYVTADVEREAMEFAAEFLMPIEVIRPQLRKVQLGKLQDLKREWGVSMQALIERAFLVGLLLPNERLNLYKSLSARGWRTQEPVSDEIPDESPRLARSIGTALVDRGLSDDDIAKLAGYASRRDNNLFASDPPKLRVV